MKIYGYTGEMEKKLNRMEEADRSEVVSELLMEQIGLDIETDTLGQMFLATVSYMSGIPKEFWNKTVSELTESDVEFIDAIMAKGEIHNFIEK